MPRTEPITEPITIDQNFMVIYEQRAKKIMKLFENLLNTVQSCLESLDFIFVKECKSINHWTRQLRRSIQFNLKFLLKYRINIAHR